MVRKYLVTEDEFLSATVTPEGDLTFTRDNGEVVVAGNVAGPVGPAGPNTIPTDTSITQALTTPGTGAHLALEAQIEQQAVLGGVRGVADRRYNAILGAIRNDGGPNYFQPIADAVHRPTFIQSVQTLADRIRVTYDTAASKVGAVLAVPDESLAAAGFTCGTSVGTNYVDIFVYRTIEFADYVSYNSGAWTSASGVFTPTFSAGVLTLTHPSLINLVAAFSGSATARSGPYVAQMDGLGLSTATVVFRDFAGTIITTPDTNMRVYVRHGVSRPVQWNPTIVDTTTFPNSNFWIIGTQEV